MILRSLSLGFFILLLASCYTRKNACLDTLAQNFDVTGDDQCDDCCVYPELKLLISHYAGDSVFNISDTLVNSFDQKYKILDVRYYLSDFSLYQSGRQLHILDSITSEDQQVTVFDDMKIVRSSDREITFGRIKGFGRFDSLSFHLGLKPATTSNVFANLPANHVLLKNYKLKDTLDNLVHLTMRYQRITPDSLISTIYIKDIVNIPSFIIDSTLVTKKGESFIYNIKADYLPLLHNTDLTLSPAEIEKAVAEKLKLMIIVK